MFGIIPDRFTGISDKLDIYFAMARGSDDAAACEMTKWFDMKYHYIVSEIDEKFKFEGKQTIEILAIG
jgi:5-methyltetrahydropteroyltriglutamate--homocysteine methyltransferase